MDQKNVKKRDVMPFDEFTKSYDKAKSVVKANGQAHPGARAIKAEELYYKNDANPYIAAGIKVDPSLANKNDKITANQVDVFPHEDVAPTKKEEVEAKNAAEVVIAAASTAALSEGADPAAGYHCPACKAVSPFSVMRVNEKETIDFENKTYFIHYDGCQGW